MAGTTTTAQSDQTRAQARAWLIALLACVASVGICIEFLDRPIAIFFETYFRHTESWERLAILLTPIDGAVLAALLFLLGCGAWRVVEGPLAPWTWKPLLCSYAAISALAADIVLKRVFGRVWPDPAFLHDGRYEFRWLSRGLPWEACFPSGTATISVAVVAVIWLVAPRLRVSAIAVAGFLCAAAVAGNFHWLGDVVAGIFLGAFIGTMTTKLLTRESLLS